MFRFAHPQYLWLLLFVPLFAGIFLFAMHRRRRRLARFGHLETLRQLMPDVATGNIVWKVLLFCTAWTLLAFVAARPQLGSRLREQKARGVEMMLVVDISNSMLAEDFEPNRLERTKYAINKLFDGLHQDRVGLIVFAGEPKVQLPITTDYRMARSFEPNCGRAAASTMAATASSASADLMRIRTGDTSGISSSSSAGFPKRASERRRLCAARASSTTITGTASSSQSRCGFANRNIMVCV